MNPLRLWRHYTRRAMESRRLLHASPARNAVPPGWLQRILDDRSEPPRLYAWTVANLPGASTGPVSRAPDRRRIYILGIGNLGRLYATCLARRPAAARPPITLVVHRRALLEHWAAQPGIELVRASDGAVERTAFDVEWWTEERPEVGPAAEIAGAATTIPNLVVATKAPDALPQVDRLRRYLGPESTVAFAQNGMCKLWPPAGEAYVRARFVSSTSTGTGVGGGPNWLACVTTHGVTSLGPFQSLHASPADALVGPVLLNGREDKCSEYLIERLVQAPGLDCRQVSRKELWVAQLEKLVVNSIINPLTAVLRCKNGELFAKWGEDGDLAPVIDALLDEASRMLGTLLSDPSSEAILTRDEIQDDGLTDAMSRSLLLQADREQLLERFSFARLQEMLLTVGNKVAGNTSSMLQDVITGKQTEINDFNGWLVETAWYLDKGLRLPVHEKLIALVKAEAVLTQKEIKRQLIPTDYRR